MKLFSLQPFPARLGMVQGGNKFIKHCAQVRKPPFHILLMHDRFAVECPGPLLGALIPSRQYSSEPHKERKCMSAAIVYCGVKVVPVAMGSDVHHRT